MNRLEQQCRKLLGLKPYDDSTNYCAGDNYFYKSIVDEFGEEATSKMCEKLRHHDNCKKDILDIILEKGLSLVEISLIRSSRYYSDYFVEMQSPYVYRDESERQLAFKTEEEYNIIKEVLE